MVTNTTVRQDTTGNGTEDTFVIPFQFFQADASDVIKVYLVDRTDPLNITTTLQALGSDWDFDDPITPLNVVMATPPTADQTLVIYRMMPLEQLYDYINTGYFPADAHEENLDKIVMMVQQLKEELSRTIKLGINATGITTELPGNIPPNYIIVMNETGDGFTVISPAELAGIISGEGGTIGEPTNGEFGTLNILGLASDMLIADGFDAVSTFLELIAPIPPAALSAKALLITGEYTALAETSGTSHRCIDDTTPEISPGTAQLFANSFRDADTGTLSAWTDGVSVGSRILTTGDDTGSYGDLDILFDYDPYTGQAGKEGIFKALIARIAVSAALSIGMHTSQMKHSTTGDTPAITFYIDDPGTVVISNKVLTAPGSSSYKSGVPGVAQGQNINVTFDVDNAVNTHYNATRIASASSSQTSSVNESLPGSPPALGATIAADINLPVSASAYSENVSVNCIGYNSKGTSVSSAVTNNVRVDTVGSEVRYLSSTGQYPGSGYTTLMNSQTDVLSGNKELQYLNGKYQYPPAVDYSSKLPAGPDYSALTADAHASMRWATFKLSTISAASSVTFTIAGATNFGATALVSGIELYLKVEGVTGWIDANAAYPGVGSPVTNGDGALDVGASTFAVKRVTFGATPRTGDVYVRIGIPSGSTKTFTGIS